MKQEQENKLKMIDKSVYRIRQHLKQEELQSKNTRKFISNNPAYLRLMTAQTKVLQQLLEDNED